MKLNIHTRATSHQDVGLHAFRPKIQRPNSAQIQPIGRPECLRPKQPPTQSAEFHSSVYLALVCNSGTVDRCFIYL